MGGVLVTVPYQRGRLKELQQLIGWKSEKEYWWEGKYNIITLIHILALLMERMVMYFRHKGKSNP